MARNEWNLEGRHLARNECNLEGRPLAINEWKLEGRPLAINEWNLEGRHLARNEWKREGRHWLEMSGNGNILIKMRWWHFGSPQPVYNPIGTAAWGAHAVPGQGYLPCGSLHFHLNIWSRNVTRTDHKS